MVCAEFGYHSRTNDIVVLHKSICVIRIPGRREQYRLHSSQISSVWKRTTQGSGKNAFYAASEATWNYVRPNKYTILEHIPVWRLVRQSRNSTVGVRREKALQNLIKPGRRLIRDCGPESRLWRITASLSVSPSSIPSTHCARPVYSITLASIHGVHSQQRDEVIVSRKYALQSETITGVHHCHRPYTCTHAPRVAKVPPFEVPTVM